MIPTRESINQSIAETEAALNALSASELHLARDRVRRELEDFIRKDWLPIKPEERSANIKRREAAEAFHAMVRVHDFWRAP